MAAALHAAITRAWQGRGALSTALLPISWIYGALTAVHRWTYARGLKRSEKLPIPVIVVGNVITGGAGKTPTALGVVAHLQNLGFKPAILSRGYGGKHQSPTVVLDTSTAQEVGDEPLVLRHSSGVPVVVGRDRVAAGKLLLQIHPDITHIVCDDGLQHYRLFRDLEICVFDSRGLGNGRLLHAGMLRQPWPRTPVIEAGQSIQKLLVLKTGQSDVDGHLATRALSETAINGHGQTMVLDALLQSGAPLHAIAGIAQPDNFFNMLRARGCVLRTTDALPDHYDFDSYSRTSDGGEVLICTEKDAIKLWQHRPDAWAVPLLQTLPPSFLAALDQALVPQHTPPVSSPHGHTTH
ncbi:MAG: tetraacyldisaccharide 4'-kinase [Betaproteobacteria bacterium]|nr:tetraacyldisaccharide 4'-kinase [Betaproteobacteria bacterium]